jgi:hypothetical protein
MRFRFLATMIIRKMICSSTCTPLLKKGGRILAKEEALKLTREQLYNEIWEISVAGVAKKYNAAYNDLLKLCKEAEIPIPPSGYWAKLKFGKPVEQILLPESSIIEVALPTNNKPKRIRKVATPKNVEETPPLVQEEEAKEQLANEVGNSKQDSQIPYRTVSGEYNTYNREKLYEEVWGKPVVKVAEQYGVSDVAIHKVCKALNVPTPPLGYWAKVRAGAKVKKTSLPKTQGVTEIIGAKTFDGVKEKTTDSGKLDFLSDNERERVLCAAEEIMIPAENAQLHKKIAAYRGVVRDWNQKDRKEEGAQRKKDYYYKPPFLAGVISNQSLPRVCRLLDALFRQVERLGGSVNDDLSLRVRNEHVSIEIAEGQDKVEHVITKQEAQALIKYRDEKHRSSWASEPQIRKYDYVFNGRLRINIRQGRYFRDTDKINIESRLGEMLMDLHEESEVIRLEREAREEEARKKAEAKRREEERRKRYNKEVERTIALENAALDYDTACRIRAYVQAVATSSGHNGLDDETVAWVEWATKKADWFDPTVARVDELFGEREHKKSSSDKVLKEKWHW